MEYYAFLLYLWPWQTRRRQEEEGGVLSMESVELWCGILPQSWLQMGKCPTYFHQDLLLFILFRISGQLKGSSGLLGWRILRDCIKHRSLVYTDSRMTQRGKLP